MGTQPELVDSIPASHGDWAVTAMFYAAVHAIDAALAHSGSRVCNHEGRFDALKQHNSFSKIRRYYHTMYDLCRKARYTANPQDWVPFDRLESDVAKGLLYPIETSVGTIIGSQLATQPIDFTKFSVVPPSPAISPTNQPS